MISDTRTSHNGKKSLFLLLLLLLLLLFIAWVPRRSTVIIVVVVVADLAERTRREIEFNEEYLNRTGYNNKNNKCFNFYCCCCCYCKGFNGDNTMAQMVPGIVIFIE